MGEIAGMCRIPFARVKPREQRNKNTNGVCSNADSLKKWPRARYKRPGIAGGPFFAKSLLGAGHTNSLSRIEYNRG
jgi:hypothetical protein